MGETLYEVIGVVEKPFTGTEPGTMIDVFVPAMMNPYVTALRRQRFSGVCSAEAGCRGGARSREARSKFPRSEEHTSELQSRLHLVCRLLLEKKKNYISARRRPQRAPSRSECYSALDIL